MNVAGDATGEQTVKKKFSVPKGEGEIPKKENEQVRRWIMFFFIYSLAHSPLLWSCPVRKSFPKQSVKV